MRSRSTVWTEDVRCPHCAGRTGAYLWKLHHAAAGYADISENKADCRDELSSVSLSQLCTNISQEDSIEISAHKNNRAGSSMDIFAAES